MCVRVCVSVSVRAREAKGGVGKFRVKQVVKVEWSGQSRVEWSESSVVRTEEERGRAENKKSRRVCVRVCVRGEMKIDRKSKG